MSFNPLYKFITPEERADIKKHVTDALNETPIKNKIKRLKLALKYQFAVFIMLLSYVCACGFGYVRLCDEVVVGLYVLLVIVSTWGYFYVAQFWRWE